MQGPVAWRIERSGRRFAADGDTVVFAEDHAAGVTRHAHPAWKIVLCPDGGQVTARPGPGGRAVSVPALVVPPQLAHSCATSGAYTAVFVDPWLAGPPAGIVAVGERGVRRLMDAMRDSALPEALVPVIERPAPLDPRVAHVLERLDGPSSLTELAAETGPSPSRLRRLTRAGVGIPLARLRQWRRLRLARDLLGRTPGSLRE